MKKVSFAFLLLLVLLSNAAYSQSENSVVKAHNKNSVFIEALGHGCFYSLNYERKILGNARFLTSGQIGISYYGKGSGIVPLWMPILINQSVSIRKNMFIEIGAGKIFRNDGVEHRDGTFQDDYQIEEWTFRLGYKHFFKNGKWLFKVAYTPIYQDKSDYIHWGGIAFGYRF